VKREQTAKEDALQRLAYIDGHLKATRKIVEHDVCCAGILKQPYAVQRALDKLEGGVLRGYLHLCVPAASARAGTR
jgi:DNA-binding FrmR family transcriptional regulator